ncbi:hypothetical protein GHT06_009208 [Daphnia sinensis]|uniref:Cyclic nucleotide-binding domain-containing protein n=1 Tax=Daphnia sinensis TaxID=1820382 RepID=A0AAD5L2N7_9CRUS|nr:hypothetical protein GHT06_009208 [Daphnia sinensis]
MRRSVGCDLPQHVAEKFSDQLSEVRAKASITTSCPSNPSQERKPFLQSIPTISIDDEVEKGTENDSSMIWTRRPTLHSIASSCVSGNSSMTVFSLDKNHFVTSRIQRLVSAFTDRAKALKERIAQPPTPSTDSSERGGRGLAPLPPPLNLRHDPPSEPDGTRGAKPFRIPSTFHPQSSVYISWLFVVSSAFMYNLWSVPLRITFPYQDDSNVYYWLVVDYVADAVYLIDTFLVHPRLRFVREGNWVEDVTDCRRNYITSLGSKIDILSLFPLDFLYFYFGLQSSLLRFPRMIRILPFWEFFDRLDMMAPSPFVIRVSRTLFYMLYLIHINACAYFFYSKWSGIGNDAFVFQGEGNAYLRCFYFAMKTATKIGKNPKPANNVDRTFMIFNWLIGVFACAAIIGQIRDIMAAAERSTTEYRERLDRTVQLMNRLNLPPKIQDQLADANFDMESTDEISSLVSLPHNMQMDIAMNVHIQTLSKVQLFQDCDPALIRDLVLKLKPVLFLPGDLVCKKGEVGKEMYIVKTGTVQVMGGPANDKVLVTLCEGSVFGEISLLAVGGGNRRMADVRSQGFSNLFVLSKSDLNEALEYHPEAQKILQRKAKKLVKKSSERQLSSEPIITPKPPTPKLVKTVLQAISADSKTRHFLLQGSRITNRTTSSMPKLAHASFPSDLGVPKEKHEAGDVLIEKDARSYSEEVLLKPNYLAANSPGALTIKRHVFKLLKMPNIIFYSFLAFLVPSTNTLDANAKDFLTSGNHTSNWAVLVDTSRFWFNYRHVANVLSIYRSVKRLGIPDSQIILMIADDMACNPRNPHPAAVYNNANQQIDVYGDDVEVDYRGYEVTVENFIRVLTGRLPSSTPRSKKLLTDAGSNVLIYLTGHGGDGFLKFQDSEEITNVDLADAIQQMWEKQRYHEMLFIVDTCQAASLYQKFYSPNVLAIGSSLVGEDSLSHHVDPAIGVYIIDRYTYYALEFLEHVTPTSNHTLGQFLKVCPKYLCLSTVGFRSDLFKRDPNRVFITDFFGSQKRIEMAADPIVLPPPSNAKSSLPPREAVPGRALRYADPIPPLCIHSLTF